MSEPMDRRAVLPDEWEDMSEKERQAWADQRADELDEVAEEELSLSDDEKAALRILSESREDEYETVTLGKYDEELLVKPWMNAVMEDRFDTIARASEGETGLSDLRETLIEACAWLVVTDGFDSEEVWRLYAQRFGTTALMDAFFTLAEPALTGMDDAEVVSQFRQDEQGAGGVRPGRGDGDDAR